MAYDDGVMAEDPELIEAQQEQGRLAHEKRLMVLNGLAMTIAARRQEAIAFRAQSGIEQEWLEDEEFYQGIDDGNRHEFQNKMTKPLPGGGSAAPKQDKDAYGSTVFPNITAPYTDAAAARIGDMLLPTDQRNFALQPTPIPDLVDVVDKLQKAMPPEMAGMKPGPSMQGWQPPAGPMGAMVPIDQPPMQSGPNLPRVQPGNPADFQVQMPNGKTTTMAQLKAKMDEIKAEASRKAQKAQDRIDDWLIECDYHGELRKVIDDCSRLGSGVIKGPFPRKIKMKAWNEDGSTLEIKEKIVPASEHKSPWDIFPDKDCGQDIHRGDYIFERDRLSATRLMDLKGNEESGYLDDMIDLVLDQGPCKFTAAGKAEAESKDLFEVWHYHGIVTRDEMEAAGCYCEDEFVHAVVVMVNDVIIRASRNPLGGGAFPYDIIPWKRRPDSPWGVGVPRQIRTPQRMVTAATRNLMNNAGLASGPQIIIGHGITPVDGKNEIRPLKRWRSNDETVDVSKAFTAVTIPMLIEELQSIIQLGLKFAEDVTGLPMLLQGQQGKAPDTVGGMTMLNNNATAVLRRIAKLFDSEITEPHIGRYYTYLLEYSEDPDEKGDFQIDARGSSALVERDIQTQEMIQVLQLSKDPAYGWDPKKAAKEYLKSRRFDPSTLEYTKEEMEQMAQQPQPKAPAVEAAQIRADASLEAKKIDADIKLAVDKSDTDRDAIYVQAEMERTENEHQGRMAELSVKRELALLDYANRHQMSLDQAKAQLAQTAMKLRVQERMADKSNVTKQVLKPPVEPKGRAPNGQAFQR